MTAPNPASADPTPITRADMLRLADELDHTCCVAGDMETSKPLRGLIAAIRATFPAPSPRPTCSRGHPIGGKMTLEQAGGKKMCECVVPAPSPAGGGWRERCVVRREDFGKSFAYAVYSSGGGFALSDGDWYGVGFPPETNARFPTESAARAALASAPKPPGVPPCESSAESSTPSSARPSASTGSRSSSQGTDTPSSKSASADAAAPNSAQTPDSPGAGGDGMEGNARRFRDGYFNRDPRVKEKVVEFARSEVARAVAARDAELATLRKQRDDLVGRVQNLEGDRDMWRGRVRDAIARLDPIGEGQ